MSREERWAALQGQFTFTPMSAEGRMEAAVARPIADDYLPEAPHSEECPDQCITCLVAVKISRVRPLLRNAHRCDCVPCAFLISYKVLDLPVPPNVVCEIASRADA